MQLNLFTGGNLQKRTLYEIKQTGKRLFLQKKETCRQPTSFHHAHFVTLPKTASLAALPAIPVNSTLIGCWAHIVIVT